MYICMWLYSDMAVVYTPSKNMAGIEISVRSSCVCSLRVGKVPKTCNGLLS